MPKRIVLEPDVFDVFELSAEAYGGIGAGSCWDWHNNQIPLCIMGHREEFRDEFVVGNLWLCNTSKNDKAVTKYNRNHNRPSDARLTWAEYCEARNIVRGAE